MHARDYLGPGGPLSRTVPAYEHRQGQLDMAVEVERVLGGDGVALLEAGTGTGKTLAYLVPAVLSGLRIVISTGSKTLQDQIVEQDLPRVRQALDRPVRAVTVKGMANYLCLRRYRELRQSKLADGASIARALPTVDAWRARTETGDRAEFRELPEDAPIWSHILSGNETRIGPRCGYYEDCFVTRVRRSAEEAQLIVVNHHLYFADLAMRDRGGVLPPYDAVIFDEAHQIPDIITQFFGVSVSNSKVDRWVRDARRALARDNAGLKLLDTVPRIAESFFSSLPAGAGVDGARTPLVPDSLGGQSEAHMHELDSALEAVAGRLRTADDDGSTQLARRAQALRDDMATIVQGRDPSRIAWLEQRGRFTSIGASPVDVSTIFREEVIYRVPSVVLTSATLSTGGNFAFIKRQLGIDFDANEAILPSPFEYAKQAAIYIAGDLPDPRSPKFPEAAADRVVDLVELTGGGAFVLCTSVRMMRSLAERCGPRARVTTLVQGDAPKSALLDAFRASGNAVLFATASFWEGVDVPGQALRLVIMDKLPFAVPTDPLVVARCERLRDDGEQPFMRYVVPSAVLGLKQGFGRLIRSRRDRGIVAVLDSRLQKKGYGKVFLRSLPDTTRCESMGELRDFWERAT